MKLFILMPKSGKSLSELSICWSVIIRKSLRLIYNDLFDTSSTVNRYIVDLIDGFLIYEQTFC